MPLSRRWRSLPSGKWGRPPSSGPAEAVGAEPVVAPGDKVSASRRSFRDDLVGTVRSVLGELTIADQCAVIGLHPHEATRGVVTAAD